MKTLSFALAVILIVGCQPTASYKNLTETKTHTAEDASESTIYVIECEGSKGWENFQTKRHPDNAYGSRSGVWKFLDLKGRSVFKSNCGIVIDPK